MKAPVVSDLVLGAYFAHYTHQGQPDRARSSEVIDTLSPVLVLRGVVALEAAVPLVVIAAVSAGTGLVAAAMFLRSQLGESLRPPGIDYYVIVLAGIVASLGVIASTLPMIERITGPEVARNE